MAWLYQPVSLTVPSAPGDFPFISSAFILLPGKMKNRGIAAPLALMHPKLLVFPRPDVTTGGQCEELPTMQGGLCSVVMPFSSLLNIR